MPSFFASGARPATFLSAPAGLMHRDQPFPRFIALAT
jgi:hypothetical protein